MAIVLNGNGQYVDLTDHGAAFDVRSRPFAFYAELKWTATGIMLAFSHGRANGGDQEYALFANISTPGRVIGRWENALGDLFQPSYSGGYNDGQWHRVLVVITSSPDNLAAIYVDGVLRTSFSVGSTTGSADHSSNLTAIGYDLDTGGWDWDGEIANAAVWVGVDFTSQQAEDLTAGVITPADLTTGQIAHYPLDYDARDVSGNSLDGTVVGGATFTEGPPTRETETWGGASDGTDISGDHTWSKVQEASGAGSWQVASERLRLASSTESFNTARAETDLGTADHYVEAELEFESVSSNEAGVCARFATSENTWYAAVMSPRNGTVSLIRCVNGARTTIASRAETVAAGTYTVRITCDGDQITGTFEGFSDLSVTDTGITTGTRWGAYGRTRGLVWGHWWDNFTAQDLAFTEGPPAGAVRVSDDFNRPNEPLDAGPWTLVDWSGTSTGFNVVSNQCVVQSSNRSGAIHDTALATDDHQVEATIGEHHVALFARGDSAGTTGYLANFWDPTHASGAELFKVEAGTVTAIDTLVGVPVGGRAFIAVVGDQITWGELGGTTKTITDTSITTGKKVGIGASGNQGSLDDWLAFDLEVPWGPLARFRASSLGLSDTDPVSTWADEVGSHDLVSASPSFTTYSAAGFNGHPAVEFQATASSRMLGPAVTGTATQPHTVVAIMQFNSLVFSGTDATAIIVDSSNGSRSAIYAAGSPGDKDWRMYASSSEVGSGISPDLFEHVVVGVFDGASSTLHVDGVQVAAGNPGADGINRLIVNADGGNPTSGQGHADMLVAEILVYDRALTATEIADLQGYFETTYAPASGGGAAPLKRWNGTAFVAGGTLKRWNGTSFVAGGTLRRWTGSAWVPAL